MKQIFDLQALRRIGRDREYRPLVLDVLPNDKTLHHPLQGRDLPAFALELDQCGYE